MLYRKFRRNVQCSLNFLIRLSKSLLFCLGSLTSARNGHPYDFGLQLQILPNALRIILISFLKYHITDCKYMYLNGYENLPYEVEDKSM